MKLAHTLKSPSDLYAKLEREGYRAFHCDHPMAKADHLYNFCITAHSLRDYFFHDRGIRSKAEKDRFHKLWNAVPELLAAAEIANTSKHFVLDRPNRTLATAPGRSKVVRYYELPGGRIVHRGEEMHDVEISLSDGTKMMMYEFTRSVIDCWFRHLTCHGIAVYRQSDDDLMSS